MGPAPATCKSRPPDCLFGHSTLGQLRSPAPPPSPHGPTRPGKLGLSARGRNHHHAPGPRVMAGVSRTRMKR